MAERPIRSEREEPLRDLYNVDVASMDHQGIEAQLSFEIDDIILGDGTPQSAAERIASLILGESDPETPLETILAICRSAALRFQDENALKKLVSFLVALASLPDAINATSEPKRATTHHPEVESGVLVFHPGEAIVFEDGIL